jgi:hypothetical protein
MMSETRTGTVKRAPGPGKLLGQLAVGFVTGGVGAYLMLMALDGASPAIKEDGSRIFAMLIGLIYALTGAAVLVGVAAPKVGAATLNVEDEEELREQRVMLGLSSVSFLLIGAFLAALALGGGEAPVVDRTIAGVVAGVAALVVVAVNIYSYRLIDELMLSMTKDAAVITTSALLLLFGGWAAIAELGKASMFQPLHFIAGFFAIYLASVFVVVGRRGLLKPR